MRFLVGTAGSAVPRQHLPLFPAPPGGEKLSHLERYAGRLRCVEINSSFHRPHRRATWERWATSTPPAFRFAVKAPKAVTHTAKLANTGAALLAFFAAARGLGEKLGPLLVQLPPKLAFDFGLAQEFFSTLRELHTGAVVVEPRHASWFTPAADQLIESFEVCRAAADPPKGSPRAAHPLPSAELAYWRLHGAPRTYYSEYEEGWLQELATELERFATASRAHEAWIIFDNTALGYATANAVRLQALLHERGLMEESSSAEHT